MRCPKCQSKRVDQGHWARPEGLDYRMRLFVCNDCRFEWYVVLSAQQAARYDELEKIAESSKG